MRKFMAVFLFITTKIPKGGELDMTTYGYVRVSSTDQNEDRQMIWPHPDDGKEAPITLQQEFDEHDSPDTKYIVI